MSLGSAPGDDKYANGGEPDLGGYSYQAPNPYAALDNINPNDMAPIFGMPNAGPQYYENEVPRGLTDKFSYNTGVTYLVGTGLGGAYGVIEGFRTSPSPKFKILLNSVLNKVGRRASKFGNAVGIAAFMYTGVEAIMDHFEVDRLTGQDWVTPVGAAATAGALYKCTAGPRTLLVASVLGGTIAGGAVLTRSVADTSALRGFLFF